MDKTALITGAAHRIGAQIVRTLHAAGYRVAVHYNTSRVQAEKLSAELNAQRPASAIAIPGDLTTSDFAAKLVAVVSGKWGRLDVLINNAAIYQPSDPDSADCAQWDTIIATNLRAPYLLSTAALPWLRRSTGVIINLTDIYALRPQFGYAAYCASKAGLVGLTKAMALDLAPQVRVNGIAPGPILWATDDNPKHRAAVIEKTPLGRLGTTTDIAAAVRYLADAPYVTGQILEVDGGRSIVI